MLERLIIRNFKQFGEVDIELGQAVVLIGPNNSGKTSALQALALWELGVRRWSEKRSGKTPPRKRPGVTLNRRELVALPVPETSLLWRDLHTHDSSHQANDEDGKKKPLTKPVKLEVDVRGVTGGSPWNCGLEFTYANPESMYCRPLRWAAGSNGSADLVPDAARAVRIAYLPPMSGLTSDEFRLDPGAIQMLLGEGRTAEVLRNLCHALATRNNGDNAWEQLTTRMRDLFGVALNKPEHIVERGQLAMSYRDHHNDVMLDLSAAGRGLQQTMLLFAFLLGNPGSVLLLDEPDAHLEILRQKQIYQALTEVAESAGSQIIAASHSEVILNEAADRDIVVAFVGKPHRIDDRGSQVLKALKSIGFDQYYQAEVTGWVLYLEGPTDLAILRAFARTLQHPASVVLDRPFTCNIMNQPRLANEHFGGLIEAKPDLVGLVLTDRLERQAGVRPDLKFIQWSRREIENYLCFPRVLENYAVSLADEVAAGPLFAAPTVERFRRTMQECVAARVPPAAYENPGDSWWSDVKATDEFMDIVFREFFSKLGLSNMMRKTDYHRLASLVPADQIDGEVSAVLDAIAMIAARARPVTA